MIIKPLLVPNKYSLLIAVIWTSLVLYLSFKVPDSLNPGFTIKNQDKVVHFTFYFVFLFLWFRYFIFKGINTKNNLIKLLLLAVCLGAIIEIAQGYFTTTRQADIFDAIANSLGAFIAFIVNLKFIKKPC